MAKKKRTKTSLTNRIKTALIIYGVLFLFAGLLFANTLNDPVKKAEYCTNTGEAPMYYCEEDNSHMGYLDILGMLVIAFFLFLLAIYFVAYLIDLVIWEGLQVDFGIWYVFNATLWFGFLAFVFL